MPETSRVNINDSEWTQISTGEENVFIQMQYEEEDSAEVLIHVGTTAPSNNNSDAGIVLDEINRSINLTGLTTSQDFVYARSRFVANQQIAVLK